MLKNNRGNIAYSYIFTQKNTKKPFTKIKLDSIMGAYHLVKMVTTHIQHNQNRIQPILTSFLIRQNIGKQYHYRLSIQVVFECAKYSTTRLTTKVDIACVFDALHQGRKTYGVAIQGAYGAIENKW